ncbi:MAG: 5'-methylthioadenosine/S-adenosylhomocysteine nucleosidase [Gammaproteobacteria bacterium RIFCSPHIGHO2_12_FULL_35_23]|nr:MAG: 5'-methylthioadenosine/S-adenosylhomocysteine nucleosidase [Gammaproteobacteria bacterium RIFCSPHIGHO2_12_FULL_35_23]
MKIGIMGAMPEEVEVIQELMTDISETTYGGRVYIIGKINTVEVVLVFSRWGKVASATTITTLINEFKIKQLIFVGVAGAVNPELNIGDIVISEKLYQHDMDPSPILPKYEIPLTGVTFFYADPVLVTEAKAVCEEILAKVTTMIPFESLTKFKISKPKCYIGTIGSGDKFITSSKQFAEILIDKPETMAVEMEGAAVAQVCHDYAIPFVIIRTISDKANHEAHIDFPAFIAEIAKHYSKYIVQHLIK